MYHLLKISVKIYGKFIKNLYMTFKAEGKKREDALL